MAVNFRVTKSLIPQSLSLPKPSLGLWYWQNDNEFTLPVDKWVARNYFICFTLTKGGFKHFKYIHVSLTGMLICMPERKSVNKKRINKRFICLNKNTSGASFPWGIPNTFLWSTLRNRRWKDYSQDLSCPVSNAISTSCMLLLCQLNST